MARMPVIEVDVTPVVDKSLRDLLAELLEEVKGLRGQLASQQPQYVYHYYPNGYGGWNYQIPQWQAIPNTYPASPNVIC